MVKRHVPLARRIAIHRGRIAGVVVWVGAVFTCALLYPLRNADTGGLAVAVVRQAEIRAPESGRLTQIHVRPGQVVNAGDALGSLEVPGLEQQITGAEARLAALRAELEMDDRLRARAFAKDADSSRARWLSAQVDLESSRARLAAMDLELGRITAPGIELPRAEVEQRQAERNALVKEIAAREAEVSALRKATASAEARAGGDEGAILDAALVEATAFRDELVARREALTLVAPVDGVVGQDLPLAGEWVVGGSVVGAVGPSQVDEAVVYVSTATARRISTGQDAELRGADGEAIAAKVSAVGAGAEGVPLEFNRDPAVATWGVPVTLRVIDHVLVPGERLGVSF